ncbi:hypothetical protein [Frigidibacter oleivorans]|uniref:hypothetical protein n=1 Tax=Frigidibacter oleivorans TaxID=2487129 RepID=UPI000F8D6778|nr:hypothetical protein [Frigidibacter oleivorans]
MTPNNAKLIPEATYWWQFLPALPERASQEYYALRRIWADHTMNTTKRGRGFYWWGTEDNMTPVLFQNWAVLESPESFAPLLAACGHKVRNLRRVRWAYACEEAITVGSFPGVDGRFLIPDIILHFEDDLGPGLVAFEVKRPKVRPTEKDASKLRAYTRLGSMRAIERKVGCFLVGSTMVNEATALSRNAPVVSWEQMLELQRSAIMRESPTLVPWLERTYALQGIGIAKAPAPSAGNRHASDESRSAIGQMNMPERQKRFLLGAETVEAHLSGAKVLAPMEWLTQEPSREQLSASRPQTTAARRICRWGDGWNPRQEH